MKKIICLILFLFVKLSISQIDEIPIDNSEEQGTFDKQAVTTSLKNAFPLAPWLNDFDKYIVNAEYNKKPGEINSGYYRINLKSFCLRPGYPVGGKGYGCVLGPLKGKKSKSVKEIIRRWKSHPEIEQKYVQTLIWGLIAGLGYDEYPKDFRTKIEPLLPDEEKKSKGFKLKDLFGLVPDELKSQIPLYDDIKNLVKAGIGSYQDLERIAVPPGDPLSSSKDMTIEPGGWTLFENGYYFRAAPIGYDNITCDIYKPAKVEISYDSKGRIISMQSETGRIDAEYDDSPGADVISINSGNYKINRIKSISFNGTVIEQSKDVLFTIPYDNKTSESSSYKRLIETKESLFDDREKSVNDYIESIKTYNRKKKVNTKDSDIAALYGLKQFELAVKMLMDPSIIVLTAEEGEKLARITTDASCNKISYVVYLNKISSGGNTEGGFDPTGLVVVPGSDGAQRIGIGGEGPDEEDCHATLHQPSRDFLPEPFGQVTVNIEVNSSGRVDGYQFEVYDISKEQGRCINDKNPAYYKSSPDPDIIVEGDYNPGYIIEGSGDGSSIIVSGEGSLVPQITLTTMDFGAYAKVKARVKIDGKWCNANCEGGRGYVKIPFDLNDNNVADKWEEDNSVSGYAPDYDEDDQPSRMANNGDGLTLFEEYRGVYVLGPDGVTPVHIRTDPKRKEIFIIDEFHVVPFEQWERASEIRAYRLSEDLVYGRLGGTPDDHDYKKVNFASTTSPGVKYAINVISVSGYLNPYTPEDTVRRGETYYLGPPVNIIRVVVFPDRIHKWLDDEIQRYADFLSSNPAMDPIHYGLYDYPRSLMQNVANMRTDIESYNRFYQFLLDNTVIHEIGHACKVEHHGYDITPEEIFRGDPHCPMKYGDVMEFAQVYFGAADPANVWRFCTSPNNCRVQFNVNDRLP